MNITASTITLANLNIAGNLNILCNYCIKIDNIDVQIGNNITVGNILTVIPQNGSSPVNFLFNSFMITANFMYF